MTDKPSGSFVLWQNTLCNPLADPISMTYSAWHDGYASGVKAEREQESIILLQRAHEALRGVVTRVPGSTIRPDIDRLAKEINDYLNTTQPQGQAADQDQRHHTGTPDQTTA